MEAKKGEKNLLSPIPLGRPDTQANSYPHLGTRGAGGRGGGGKWMETLPGVFDMLQYFETILPLVESL